MVREGEKPKRFDAVCWSVEVVKGARVARRVSVSVTSATVHGTFFAAAIIRSVSSAVFGSIEQVARKVPSFALKFAKIRQKVSGLNALISRSRSTKIRRAGD